MNDVTIMPGEATRQQTWRNNTRVPRFIEEPCNVVAKVGQTAIIDCVVRGDRSDNNHDEIVCQWFYEGRLISEHDTRFRSLYENDGVVGLEISAISVEDEGEYKCVAFNTHGKTETKCELLVNVEGKVIEPPRDSTYRENETAVFKCRYDGNPRPEVKWFLGKKEIKNGSKYNIVNKHHLATLEIYDLTCEDGGGYSIVVSNDAGEDEVNFRLTIATRRNGERETEDLFSMSRRIDEGCCCKCRSNLKKDQQQKNLSVRSMLKGKFNTREGDILLEYDLLSTLERRNTFVVKECASKQTGHLYSAKIIPYDNTDHHLLASILNEYELLSSTSLRHKCLPKLHEIWILRAFAVMLTERYHGLALLDHFATKDRYSEEEVSDVVMQLCEGLSHLHAHNIIHLDIRPCNIRYFSSGSVKIVDFGSAQEVRRKMCFPDSVHGLSCIEFCAPETLEGDLLSRGTDMWSVAVIAYILCTGLSPFFYGNNKEVNAKAIKNVKMRFQTNNSAEISNDVKHFIKRIFLRIPEMRMSAGEACHHQWFCDEKRRVRLSSPISVQDHIKKICERLNLQDDQCLVELPVQFEKYEECDDSSLLLSGDDV